VRHSARDSKDVINLQMQGQSAENAVSPDAAAAKNYYSLKP